MPELTTEERRWRAEDDARAMMQAEEVKADKARLQAAQEAANRMLKEEEEKLRRLRTVAGSRRKEAPSTEKKTSKPPTNQHNVFQRI